MKIIPNRRRHPRHSLTRPCKVFHWPTQRYLFSTTCDVSNGGALLLIDSMRMLAPDDRIDVLIAWNEEMILRESDHIRARVVRSLPSRDHEQLVAVEFDQAIAEPLAAAA
jgi:hypothetical protein